MRPGGFRPQTRGLSAEEAALWRRLAETVTPIAPKAAPRVHKRRGAAPTPTAQTTPEAAPPAPTPGDFAEALAAPKRIKGRVPPPLLPPPPSGEPRRTLDRHGLDGTWERRLARGTLAPEFTLDMHGLSLDQAYVRLDQGLGLAAVAGARLVLVITGKARPRVDSADRGSQRGVIRAKLLDWLAEGSHAGRIAAVRPAHLRHGGAGAVYVVLRKPGV